MRCKYCGVEVKDNVKICPICHEKLEGYLPDAPSMYPPKDSVKRKRKHTHFTFDNLYWGIGLAVWICCLAVCEALTPTLQWHWLVIVLILYGYLFVRNTILSNSSIGLKIFTQIIMILAVLISSLNIFKGLNLYHDPMYWILEYALPIVLGTGLVIMIVFVCIFAKRRPSLIVDCVFMMLLGYAPIIMYLTGNVTHLWPSLTVSIVATLAIISCFMFGRKELLDELKKRFHL